MRPKTTVERFLSYTEPEPNSGCWLWSGATTGEYGTLWANGRYYGAHRLAYEMFIGPIPDGLHIDHLCRVRYCVNPDHLEPVTMRENNLRGVGAPAQNARKTRCLKGHAFDAVNTHVRPGDGGRECRQCKRERQRAARKQKDLTQKEAAALAEAKWGYGARARMEYYGNQRTRHVFDAFAERPNGRSGSSWHSWREACERAGLVAPPATEDLSQ